MSQLPPSSAQLTFVPDSSVSNAQAVLWASAGVGLFAFVYVSGKLTGSTASALQIMWLRYVGGFATVCVWLLLARTSPTKLTTRQPHVHALRAAAGGFGGVAAVYAAANMPVASASAIGLLDGMFIVIVGVWLLGEEVSKRQWTAACVCLAGALAVLGGKGAFTSFRMEFWAPAGVALCGAGLVALESLLIKRLARSEPVLPVLFYVNLFGMLILAGPGLSQWASVPLAHVLLFLLLGPIAILAQTCNIMAFRRADAAVIGPVRYLWIVFGLLFGLLLFDEQPTPLSLIGACLVLAGGAWLAATRARRGSKQ